MPQQNDPVTELYHALGLVGLGFTIAGARKALTDANLAVIATPQSDRLETHNPAIAAELHLAAHRALGGSTPNSQK